MITYVINTSENKTFDSDQLFRLSGYKKIHWLNASLNKVDDCIEYIKNRQGAIESEEFRVSVLVDFFGFDRIRAPYGKFGYAEDTGVEWSLYLPYIEAYLKDKLFYALEKQELYSTDYEVFYIKGSKLEIIENVSNLREQIDQIVEPVESSCKGTRSNHVKQTKKIYHSPEGKDYTEEEINAYKKELSSLNKSLDEDLTKAEKAEALDKIDDINDFLDGLTSEVQTIKTAVEEKVYTKFKLYCTNKLSLEFKIDDFPYIIDASKAEGISLRQFFDAFCDRTIRNRKIRRYFYNTSQGGSPAKTAFENLALSLNLIRLYEREDEIREEGTVEVSAIDAVELKNLLVNAWNKIIQAETIAKENNSLYFSLKQISEMELRTKSAEEIPHETLFRNERAKLVLPDNEESKSIDKQFSYIMSVGKQGDSLFLDEDKVEFDKILSKYLQKRNSVTERDVAERFNDLAKSGRLATTNQFPPKQELDYIVGKKQDEISKLMSGVLKSEYSVEKFDEEKKAAKKYYENYLSAKKVLQRGTIGDIIFLLLTLIVVVVPYIVTKSIIGFNFATIMVYLLSIAMFFGAFLLAFFLVILPSIKKMKQMKKLMLECYKDCIAKKKVALYALKKRYEIDLIAIEDFRNEITQLIYLYEQNVKKNRNINTHRFVLNEVEDSLSTILNNLGVQPIIDDKVKVDREFDIRKSIRSPENKVYKVFSLDAIETLLEKKKKGGE